VLLSSSDTSGGFLHAFCMRRQCLQMHMTVHLCWKMIPLLHLHCCLSQQTQLRTATLRIRRCESNTKDSEADDSSVSSLSTSKSIWDKGYHFPEAVTILSTVAVAKSAIKSNLVTQSTPCQRQAKLPTMDSPTSSVLSPIEKHHLHMEESREVVIAVTEKKRKICWRQMDSRRLNTTQPSLAPS